MKKRAMAFILCAMMIFTSVPLTPVGNIFSMEASAANVSDLQAAFDSVPPKSEWEKYIDTSTLSAWYDLAQQYLESPDVVSQASIDNCADKLSAAVAALKLHATGISLNRASITSDVGSSFTLRATLTPASAGDSITWKSSNTSVATVTSSGVVNVLKYSQSSVTISASSNGHTATCLLTIENPLNSVKLSQTTASLYDGQKLSLKATVTGIDASASPSSTVFYTWNSSNTAVATVSDTGAVTATGAGSCTISVTATDGGGSFTAKCTVSVSAITQISSFQPITVTSSSTLSMTAGEKVDFQLGILPTSASIKTLKWTSSDPSVATVTGATVTNAIASARITAISSGKTKITYAATDGSGKSGYFVVNVKPLVSSISLSNSMKVISADSTGEKITATVLPTNAGNQVLSWSSSNPSVCEVDYNGNLYPKANGTCTISCSTTDGSKLTVTASIRVAARAASVALNKATQTLDVGTATTLKATVSTIDGSTYSDVSWSSGDTKIASVSQSGVVTAKYPGTVVIKATALDGTSKAAVCIVTVNQPVTGVTLPTSKSIAVGSAVTLTPTFVPTYASNKNVAWASSDKTVATVNSSGVVTGQSTGTAVITVKTADGGYTAKCTVNVVVATSGVKLNKSSASINKGKTVVLSATVSPSNATNKNVVWKSDNTAVATVSSAGVVTGVAGGTCTITCTTASGGFTAKCKITVIEAVSAIAVKYTKLKMYTTQQYTLKTIITPSTATNQAVTWSSNNTSVATVSSAGVITAINVGTAIITVKTEDGGFTSSATLTVTKKVSVTSLKLNITSKTLQKGSSYSVVATITPSNASQTGISWSSSDASVATVSSSGVIKALKPGNTVITAKTKDGGFTQKCTIKVVSTVTGVKLNATSVRLALGKSKTLTPTVYPTDATYKEVTWKSTNTKVAVVSKSGVVTAVGSGNCSIIVTTVDGEYSAACNFTIYTAVKGVQINTTSLKVPKGESRLLSAIISPSNATTKTVTWASSNTNIATINSSGQVTGKRAGTVVITATTADGGYKATCTVKVYQPATGVSLDYTSITMDAGKTKTIGFKISPSTATYKYVTWKSYDTSIAKVSSSGVVTAIGAGTVIIRAFSADKNAYASCKITVTQPVKSVVLNYTKLSVKVGSMKAITATVKPNNATNSLIRWTSSNKKIATVDANGVVKGVYPGKVTITATSVNGSLKATCAVVVIRPVTGVRLNKTSLSINVGRSTTLVPTILPSDATYKTVTWSSSNYDVATVNSAGKITAKSAGYAEITAKTKDGSYKAKCKVLVIQPVTGVTLSASSKYVEVGETTALKATVKPSTASNKTVVWSSSNKAVCKVSSSGKLVGVKTGSAVITVKTVDGSFVAKCKVAVVRKVTGVSLNKSKITLYLGKSAALTATVLPKDATVKTLKWVTSDSSIAYVSQSGVVKGLKVGTCVIAVRSTDGSHTAKCTVTVKIPPTKVALSKTSISLKTAGMYTLAAKVSPSNATNKAVTWVSSNTKVAKVTSKGVVVAIGKGTATITAITENKLTATCKVNVIQQVTGVSLNKSEYVVYAGYTAKLAATVLPTNANVQTVTWSTSNAAVLAVSSSGTIKGIKAGTAVITVKTADGGYTAKCTVTVRQHVTEVTLDQTALSLKKGQESDLKVTILPTNATNKTYRFTSSDSSVVSVGSTGHIIALKGGSAEISVTSTDMAITAKCMVTVIEPVTGMTFDKTDMTIFVGETDKIMATISPVDASNRAILWSTSNPSVLSVDSNGTVKALKSGTAIITGVTSDGGYKGTCGVTVLQKATGIALSESAISMKNGSEYTLTAAVQPDDAYNKKYTWSSSAQTVATVDDGKITAINPGETTISVVSEDGSFKATCVVTVFEPVTGITLSKNELLMYKDTTQVLSANIAPSNATNQNIIWSSSDSRVVSVENGRLTAMGKGTAFVFAKTQDGGFIDMCNVEVIIAVDSVSTDKTEISIAEGESGTVAATVLPETAENKDVTWTSADESIATVENGVITAVSKGETVITVSSAENSEIKYEVAVKVIRKVTDISLDVTEKTINNGEDFTITANVMPLTANDRSVIWTSSDETVATVDENGKVTALSRGEATITATTVDGEKTAQCSLTVKQLVTEITFDEDNYIIVIGEEITPECSILPENANDKSLSWTSSDINVATVSNGTIKGISAGTAQITVNSNDNGAQAQFTVQVYTPATSITIDTLPTLWVGDTTQAVYSALPTSTTDSSVTWESSDEAVATVENGLITAVSAGTATITATAVYGGCVGTATVIVRQQITGIKLDRTQKSLNIGDSFTLVATVLPENAYDKSVTWISENSEIATVDSDGLVNAKKTGVVNIKAVTKDENIVAVCSVKIIKLAESVVLSNDTLSIEKGEISKLIATVYPENATEKDITWVSSDETVATVADDGTVTALMGGYATITALTTTENVFAECDVTVNVTSTSVALDRESASLYCGEALEIISTVTPADTTDKTIIWSSSDESIATVNDGKVTAIEKGTAIITATMKDSGVSAQLSLTVNKKVSGITISEKNLTIENGESATISASILPADATNKAYTFSSGDNKVVTVDSDGKIIAKAVGKTFIVATSDDGSFKDICIVTVTQKPLSVSLDKTSITADEGETVTLKETVLPIFATDKSVTWESADETIATVADGVVTARKLGETTIRVRTNNNNCIAQCQIVVTKPVLSVELAPKDAITYIDKQTQITATVMPENATDKSLVWSSSDESVATVDENGVVTGHSIGTVTISATSVDKVHAGECSFTVRKAVSTIELDNYTYSVLEGTDFTLNANPLPTDASNRDVIWKSSDESVATVENGVVKGISVGQASITAISVENPEISAVCQVQVTRAVTGITLEVSKRTIYIGHAENISAGVLPTDATDKTITYKTSDSSVVTVSEDGTLNGNKVGTAFIIATTKDGGFSKACSITVKRAIEKITLDSTELYLDKNSTQTINLSVSPTDATTDDIIWSTSDAEIATVSDGVIKSSSKSGVVTITATSIQNNDVFATCSVIVKEAVESVDLDDIELNLRKGATAQLTATVSPANATLKYVTWKSTDIKVATVDSNGKITAVSSGSVSIIVTTVDGEHKALCNVKVFHEIESMSIKCASTSIRNTLQTNIILETVPAVHDETIRYISDNEGIATVDSNGTITGVGGGKTVITAISSISGKVAKCEITVIESVTGISFTSATLSEMIVGTNGKISYSVFPSNATNQAVTWHSSNTKVATVSADGTINYVSKGTVTITITSQDNEAIFAKCTVTVK